MIPQTANQVADLEGKLNKVSPLEGGVGAGHGNDLGLLHQQVVDPVPPCSQQLKRTELLQRDTRKLVLRSTHQSLTHLLENLADFSSNM